MLFIMFNMLFRVLMISVFYVSCCVIVLWWKFKVNNRLIWLVCCLILRWNNRVMRIIVDVIMNMLRERNSVLNGVVLFEDSS